MAVSGVSSGAIDVRGLVDQLMQVERKPLKKLQERESQAQSRLSAFGRVQGALSALESALAKLRQPNAFRQTQATVNGTAVTATSSAAAAAGRYAVQVTQLARAQSFASTAVASASADIGAGTVTIRDAAGTIVATVQVGDSGTGTLQELRDEINAAGVGVRASLVNDGGQLRLVLNASATGTAHAFTVEVGSGLTISFTQTQSAQDAQFSVNGLALTSPSNTVKDVLEGVTLNLAQLGSAEVVIDSAPEKVKEAVAAFVKAYNDLESLIQELTKYDPATKTAAILNGESTLRRIQTQLRELVTASRGAPPGDFERLSQVGIEIQRDGTLRLNDSQFTNAVAADAAKVARLFTATSAVAAEQGFAVRLRAQVQEMLAPQGLLAARQDGLRASIRTLDQQQERMEARLALVEKRLLAQFSKLDALLTTRQQQSAALANALAALPSVQQSK
ncbi:MAG: flagellar filament capping protein FliD [Sutterellaceae bacterium]|nr:flagellar filament capping protein FliD [Burkholderiaceae bacterium]MDW8430898.1 flagellar filament capping protein FliD [Sutterellaceae bacterium]